MNVLDRARRIFDRRPEGTPGQLDQERETAVSLGLMAEAKAAGAEMTDEQAIFLSSSIAGMNARIAYLRGPDVPKPLSLAQERELTMIERELARLEGRDEAAPVLVAREGETRPRGFLGAVAGVQLWHVLAVGWAVTFGLLGVQTARVASLKADVRELNADVAMGERNLAAARTERDLLAEAVVAANENAQQTARNVEEERRLRARAEEQLRRARRAAAQARSDGPIDYGFGGVRSDQPPTPGTDSGAGSGTGNPR